LDIATCQRTYGKRILVGIGGATDTVTFKNDAEAKNFGDAAWNTFGASSLNNIVRPFGKVIVDGFGFDNQTPLSPRLTRSNPQHRTDS
jgi:chitinase